MVTFSPLACNSFANEAAMIPLPNDDVTPPVTKIYLAIQIGYLFSSIAKNLVKKPSQNDQQKCTLINLVQNNSVRSCKSKRKFLSGKISYPQI